MFINSKNNIVLCLSHLDLFLSCPHFEKNNSNGVIVTGPRYNRQVLPTDSQSDYAHTTRLKANSLPRNEASILKKPTRNKAHVRLSNQHLVDCRSINRVHRIDKYMSPSGLLSEAFEPLLNLLNHTQNRPFHHPLDYNITTTPARWLHGYQAIPYFTRQAKESESWIKELYAYSPSSEALKAKIELYNTTYFKYLKKQIRHLKQKHAHPLVIQEFERQARHANPINEKGEYKPQHQRDPRYSVGSFQLSELISKSNINITPKRMILDSSHAIGLAPYATRMAEILDCPHIIPMAKAFCRLAEIRYNW